MKAIARTVRACAKQEIQRERKVPVPRRKRLSRVPRVQSKADWSLQGQLDVALSEPCVAGSSSRSREAMPGVAEAALGEGEYFRRANRKHERAPDFVAKPVLTDAVSPASVPLVRPSGREPLEVLGIGDADRLPFDYHVEAALPPVGAGDERHARVVREVECLLLARRSARGARSH